MKLVFRNVWRNRKLSLIATLMVAVSAFFLMVFSDNIATYEKKLDESCNSLKATAHIMGSNATATPQLTEAQYQSILNTGFVAEHSVMKDQKFGDNDVMRGINSPDIDVTLKVCVDNMVWAEGYDESVFTSSECVCVAPANAWLEPGQQWDCLIENQTVTLTVAGVYGSKYVSRNSGMVYYCPIDTMKAIHKQLGMEFTYSGMKMELQNLKHLDTFKQQMKKLGMSSGNARLVINDSQLQNVTSQLKRQVRLLESLLPILLVLIAAIGFGLSFLLLRSRRRETAILRSLGMKRSCVFVTLLSETALQTLAGVLIAALAGWYLLGAEALRLIHLAALILCYLLGGAVAVWKISGINVFNIMTAKE